MTGVSFHPSAFGAGLAEPLMLGTVLSSLTVRVCGSFGVAGVVGRPERDVADAFGR